MKRLAALWIAAAGRHCFATVSSQARVSNLWSELWYAVVGILESTQLGELRMIARMTYDAEADVLIIWLSSDRPLHQAAQNENFVVHTAADGTPLFIEVLNAREWLNEALRLIPRGIDNSTRRTSTRQE